MKPKEHDWQPATTRRLRCLQAAGLIGASLGMAAPLQAQDPVVPTLSEPSRKPIGKDAAKPVPSPQLQVTVPEPKALPSVQQKIEAPKQPGTSRQLKLTAPLPEVPISPPPATEPK